MLFKDKVSTHVYCLSYPFNIELKNDKNLNGKTLFNGKNELQVKRKM
jgi:hypothetical protein